MIEILRTRKKGERDYDYMTRRDKVRLLKRGIKFSDSYSLGFYKDWEEFWKEESDRDKFCKKIGKQKVAKK